MDKLTNFSIQFGEVYYSEG